MGADPATIDAYGRSCFDWVAVLIWDELYDPPTLSSKERIIEPKLIVNTQNKYICLAISEIKVLTEVERENISQYVRRYEHLGRLLMQRKRHKNACTAFERSSSHMRRDFVEAVIDSIVSRRWMEIHHGLHASFAASALKSTFANHACKNITLGEIKTGIDTLERCTRHTFPKVPSPE